MTRRIAQVLQVEVDQVNVKATTEEKLGFTGRGEGISAHSVAIITRK
jgi:2-C-methyl-D-erythritol 2,4-cyclodiphosphate synthase